MIRTDAEADESTLTTFCAMNIPLSRSIGVPRATVILLVLVVDCIPGRQTEDDDDHEYEQENPASYRARARRRLLSLAGRARTTTTTSTSRRIPRLFVIVLVVDRFPCRQTEDDDDHDDDHEHEHEREREREQEPPPFTVIVADCILGPQTEGCFQASGLQGK